VQHSGLGESSPLEQGIELDLRFLECVTSQTGRLLQLGLGVAHEW